MDVELYIYDLSRGMARQYSRALTGIQIDAIYHTAIVLGGVEYFFGQGIHRKIPGSTHHGRPMNVVKLGRTDLPLEVIQEYVESLETIYTPESYDLFLHNCNNFSQDLAMFLVGKAIPEEIRNLPETFLKTPMGQMLRGQLDQSMRQMTQAPDAVAGQSVAKPTISRPVPQTKAQVANGVNQPTLKHSSTVFVNGTTQQHVPGSVHNITSTSELDRLLKSAESTCAAIFFTSATCPPCKIVYPAYDQLADEAGKKAVLIKVDTSKAYDVAMRYQIRATPTFITFLKGKKDQEWSGAHESRLRGNIRLLVQMANPEHRHASLRLPSLQHKIHSPIMYTRLPPLEKLVAKIGASAEEKPVQDLVKYLKIRERDGMAQSALPDLHSFGEWTTSSFQGVPSEVQFAVVDLVRIAAADARVSSYLVTEHEMHTLNMLMPTNIDFSQAPYNVQVVTLQMACNLFGSNIFQENMMDATNTVRKTIEHLASNCLLARHHNVRSLAAALVYNLAALDHNERMEGHPDKVNIASMGDLEAALVEAVVNEDENKDCMRAMLHGLGLLLYAAPSESSIWDLCAAMEVRAALKEKVKIKALCGEPLLKEIGEELLAKGGYP